MNEALETPVSQRVRSYKGFPERFHSRVGEAGVKQESVRMDVYLDLACPKQLRLCRRIQSTHLVLRSFRCSLSSRVLEILRENTLDIESSVLWQREILNWRCKATEHLSKYLQSSHRHFLSQSPAIPLLHVHTHRCMDFLSVLLDSAQLIYSVF